MNDPKKYDSTVAQYLPPDLQLGEESYISEADFLEALSQKVMYLLQYDSGVFFQLLYKIDVLEPKLKHAMQTADPAMSISKLILERRLESLAARRSQPTKDVEDKDLKW